MTALLAIYLAGSLCVLGIISAMPERERMQLSFFKFFGLYFGSWWSVGFLLYRK